MTARNTLAAVLCAAALALLAYLIELSTHLSEPGAYFVTALFAATFTLLLTQRATTDSSHQPRRAPVTATAAAFNHGTLRAGKERGSVKWFSASKGFGFITRDSGEDIFVHFRSIHGSGHRILHEGQRVEFAVSEGSKGLQAEDVTALK